MRKEKKLFISSLLIWLCLGSGTAAGEVFSASLLPKRLVEGWEQVGNPQVYDRQTLFKRINGQAELFFKYGFEGSVFTLYQNKQDEKDQVEVDLYDMGNVVQAFGIFSRFRSEDRSAGVGLESYLEDTSLLFYKGRYFVMLYATQAEPPVLKKMAMRISSLLPEDSSIPEEILYFPKEGLRRGSIEYHPEGLLGYQFLKKGFLATYLRKGEDNNPSKADKREVQLFFAIFGGSEEAGDALDAYKAILAKGGEIESGLPIVLGEKGLRGADPNHGQVLVVQKGRYLAGAVSFESDDEVQRQLSELIRNLK